MLCEKAFSFCYFFCILISVKDFGGKRRDMVIPLALFIQQPPLSWWLRFYRWMPLSARTFPIHPGSRPAPDVTSFCLPENELSFPPLLAYEISQQGQSLPWCVFEPCRWPLNSMTLSFSPFLSFRRQIIHHRRNKKTSILHSNRYYRYVSMTRIYCLTFLELLEFSLPWNNFYLLCLSLFVASCNLIWYRQILAFGFLLFQDLVSL